VFLNNLLNSSESELYHANNATSGDDNTAYDPLNRLAGFERGTLSSSGNNGSALDTVASPNASQSWNLNAVGDQSSVTTNGTTTTNSTNAKNELTTNGSNSLTFDDNGNETTDENGQTTTYDAWNRAITVKSAGGTTIASYSYDPTGRRITETTDSTGSPQTTDIYFSNQWQDIEERQSGTVTRQNLWGLGYVNQLVERDDNSATGNLGVNGSALGERLYAQQDANWNVTALVDISGSVVERMVYSPYGAATFLTQSWTPSSDGYGQNVLFQGGTFEASTGNYIFEHRDYDPATGTWKEQDAAGYIDGVNRYQLESSNAPHLTDPSGFDDFIAVEDSFVWLKYFPTMGFHYAITYWHDPCDTALTVGRTYKSDDLGNTVAKGAVRVASVELEPDPRQYSITVNMQNVGAFHETLDISTIVHGGGSFNGWDLVPIETRPDRRFLKDDWDMLTAYADTYPYAEHAGFNGVFKNWPRSIYSVFGNNSKTFAEWLTSHTQLPWYDLSGWHPGNDSPADPPTYYSAVVPTKI